MDLTALLIAIPIFLLFYQGIGLFMDSRSEKQWVTASETPKEEVGKKAQRGFIQLSERFSFNKVLLKYGKMNEKLELLLIRSGHPFGWKAENFLFMKEFVAIVAMLLCWRVGAEGPLPYFIAGAIGFLLPDFYMKAKVQARQSAIQKLLPGFVDLTALTLEGGLDFLAAVERIVEKMKTTDLKDELSLLLQECRLGTPRKEALQHLSHRVNLSDMQSLSSIIIQSEELGTSLSTVLRSYAEDMRSKRVLRAEEQAGKAPVKLLFPMMVFFFPIVFVIIFGPIALNYMATK